MAPVPRLLFALSLVGWLFLGGWSSAQDLPVKGPESETEKAAADLLDGLPLLQDKVEAAPVLVAPTLQQAEARLERVQQKAARWDKLAKQGVISRMEADAAALDVPLAMLVCEQARLVEARAVALAAAERAAATDPTVKAPDPEKAPAVVEAAAKVAAAQAEWNRKKLETARTNVARFRKLYSAHLVSKAQLQKFEALVASLETEAGATKTAEITPASAPAASVPPAPVLPGAR